MVVRWLSDWRRPWSVHDRTSYGATLDCPSYGLRLVVQVRRFRWVSSILWIAVCYQGIYSILFFSCLGSWWFRACSTASMCLQQWSDINGANFSNINQIRKCSDACLVILRKNNVSQTQMRRWSRYQDQGYVTNLCIYDILCVILEVIIFMVIINSHLTFNFYLHSSLRDLLLAVSTEYTFHLATNFLYTYLSKSFSS